MLTGPTRVALVQAAMAPLFAISGLVLAGVSEALAVFYGVSIAWVASVLLVWREHTALQHPEWDGQRLFGVFARTEAERLIVVILMLGLGFGVLELSPLPLLLGLALAQMAWLAVALTFGKKTYANSKSLTRE